MYLNCANLVLWCCAGTKKSGTWCNFISALPESKRSMNDLDQKPFSCDEHRFLFNHEIFDFSPLVLELLATYTSVLGKALVIDD